MNLIKLLIFLQKLFNKLPECLRYTKQQLNFWRIYHGIQPSEAQETGFQFIICPVKSKKEFPHLTIKEKLIIKKNKKPEEEIM